MSWSWNERHIFANPSTREGKDMTRHTRSPWKKKKKIRKRLSSDRFLIWVSPSFVSKKVTGFWCNKMKIGMFEWKKLEQDRNGEQSDKRNEQRVCWVFRESSLRLQSATTMQSLRSFSSHQIISYISMALILHINTFFFFFFFEWVRGLVFKQPPITPAFNQSHLLLPHFRRRRLHLPGNYNIWEFYSY